MEGRIKTFTVIRTAPEGFEDQVPYCVALIETATGTECVRLEGYNDDVEICVGMLVEGTGKNRHFRIASHSTQEKDG